MKKIRLISMLALAIMVAVGATSCKPKDADIQKAVQTAVAANPDATGVTVAVEKGVVTLTGEVKDEAASMAINGLAAAVKNVKSVVNNMTIAAPLVNPVDAQLIEALKDEYGNFKALKKAAVVEAIMTGEANGLLEETRYDMDDKGEIAPSEVAPTTPPADPAKK